MFRSLVVPSRNENFFPDIFVFLLDSFDCTVQKSTAKVVWSLEKLHEFVQFPFIIAKLELNLDDKLYVYPLIFNLSQFSN